MNLLINLIFSKNYRKYFLLVGGRKFLIDSIISGSMEIPSSKTICPNKFPLLIPKIDFSILREMPYFLQHSNIVLRCEICAFISLETTVKSYWYISMILFIISLKEKSIALWKVDLMVMRPKGILNYIKVPQGVVNEVLS
jgi:hypothetical protein